MAISNLLPRKTMGTKTVNQTIKQRMEYDQRDEKTKGGKLVTAYMCSPENAAQEFLISRNIYMAETGRSQPKKRDIIMYRIIQSFAIGEITPEEANRIGRETAMRFTKGKHQFVVSTHIDKSHIHNHIEFNSINLDCDGKFNNYKNTSFVLRRLNDIICRENGLSVIEKPKGRGQRYAEKAAAKYGQSFKERLRCTIETILPECGNFDEFLERMRSAGYEIKLGKHIGFRAPDQENFTRAKTLGVDYTEDALRRRIEGIPLERTAKNRKKNSTKKMEGAVNLIIDIQKKMDEGKNKGYERWARVYNIKETAKTLNFLTENKITSYDELDEYLERAVERFEDISLRIKQLEGRISNITKLKTHIINYSKTREIYVEYKKSRHKNEFRSKHKAEIEIHEAAKKAFDALGGEKIPKISELSEKHDALLIQKKELYAGYQEARKDMIAYKMVKQNIERILEEKDAANEQNRQRDSRL